MSQNYCRRSKSITNYWSRRLSSGHPSTKRNMGPSFLLNHCVRPTRTVFSVSCAISHLQPWVQTSVAPWHWKLTPHDLDGVKNLEHSGSLLCQLVARCSVLWDIPLHKNTSWHTMGAKHMSNAAQWLITRIGTWLAASASLAVLLLWEWKWNSSTTSFQKGAKCR